MTDYYSELGLKYRQRRKYKNSILKRDDFTCQVCGGSAQEVDHILPWAISHDSSESNLRAICIECNRRLRRPRSDANPFATLEDWYQYLSNELTSRYI